MNVKLLRKVKRHILAEPNRLLMNYFIAREDDSSCKMFVADGGCEPINYAKCGTAACIAGWTCVLSGQDKLEYGDIEGRAGELLAIDDEAMERLFYVPHWPQGMRHEYNAAITQENRATVAAERIEHFIKTGE